jgi:hypothetical protein
MKKMKKFKRNTKEMKKTERYDFDSELNSDTN